MTDYRDVLVLCKHPNTHQGPDDISTCKHEIKMGRCPDHDCEGWIYQGAEPII